MADPQFRATRSTFVCEAQRGRRARHRRQQADRHDALDAVRADRRSARRRSRRPHAGPLRRPGPGRPRLRAAPPARQLAIHARRSSDDDRAYDVEGRARGASRAAKGRRTCSFRWAMQAGRPASSRRRSRRTRGSPSPPMRTCCSIRRPKARLPPRCAPRHRLLASVRRRRARMTCSTARARRHGARVRFRNAARSASRSAMHCATCCASADDDRRRDESPRASRRSPRWSTNGGPHARRRPAACTLTARRTR